MTAAGRYAELLRRLAHWLMKEPELEENRIEAHREGNELSIVRHSVRARQDAGRRDRAVGQDHPGDARRGDRRARARHGAGGRDRALPRLGRQAHRARRSGHAQSARIRRHARDGRQAEARCREDRRWHRVAQRRDARVAPRPCRAARRRARLARRGREPRVHRDGRARGAAAARPRATAARRRRPDARLAPRGSQISILSTGSGVP